MEELSIVITNYNRFDDLERCISSVIRYTPQKINYKIIVVDDNSTDNSAEMIRNKFNTVEIIVNDSNVGYVKSLNKGLNKTKADYILILDSHTQLIEDIVTPMIEYFSQDNSVVSKEGLPCGSYGPYPSVFKFVIGQKIYNVIHYYLLSLLKKHENISHSAVYSSCMMTRKFLIEKIGLFDERFYFLEADVEFCYRIKNAGMKNIILENHKIIHNTQANVISDLRIIEYHKSQLEFFIKYRSIYLIPFIKVSLFIRHLIELIVLVLLISLKQKDKNIRYQYQARKILFKSVLCSYNF
jgi:GT2 family glycosyltransferase